ncbi:MAG: histidine kinase dimerization/phospho-acceptor domain-containing protein [Novosphingobium sp.]
MLINPNLARATLAVLSELAGVRMHFDDRLATVLRSGASGERAARTQYRQLLDLIGTLPANAIGITLQSGYERLEELARMIPAAERAAIIRDQGIRLANPRLVARLAEQEAEVATAAMASARLTQEDWLALIPALPVRARGLLRHRKNLGGEAEKLLARLGIRDLVLTGPASTILDDHARILEPQWIEPAEPAGPAETEEPDQKIAPVADDPAGREDQEAIGAIVRRIEAFRRARESLSPPNGPDSPRLPLGERQESDPGALPRAFDFETNAHGHIAWTDPSVAPMAVGLRLGIGDNHAPARLDPASGRAMRDHLPINAGTLAIDGAPAISGLWRIDATPRFDLPEGNFTGYCGRLRRKPTQPLQPAENGAAHRMRELLHELRTPVNAIQGFAEVIQQQVFGPAPHEYRALAATIAGDAARILAGFDELDRLARLESDTLELEPGQHDFTAALRAIVAQLTPFLDARSGGISLWGDDEATPVPLAKVEADRVAWRLLATLCGAMTAGEQLDIHVAREPDRVIFAFELPAALADRDDIFSAAPRSASQAITAGLFGSGFAFRLARAEARAVGGGMAREGDTLQLWFPLLTADGPDHSHGAGDTEGEVKRATRSGSPGARTSSDAFDNGSSA